jgi:hypothetical protein
MFARDALMRLAIAVMVALGLLAQGAALPLAGPVADPFWALGGICGPDHAAGSPGVPGQQERQHCHGACCQLWPAGFLLAGAPVLRPARAVLLLERRVVGAAPRLGRMRPAYASRAPPGLG